MKKSIIKWLTPLVVVLALALALTGCTGGGTVTITEAGSTTVQPLAQLLADEYMAAHANVTVTISGGGTSVGIQSAAAGTVNIGAASRNLTPEELGLGLVTYLLGRDAVVVIGHPSNNVTGLTTSQTRDIFRGIITSWAGVGGANATITVHSREEGSGTLAFFKEKVMTADNVTYNITGSAITHSANGEMRTAVASDPNAIGFLSMGYVDSSVKVFALDGVPATIENAESGAYTFVRPLFFVTLGVPTGEVLAFINFCLSPAGQAIVATSWLPL